MSLRTKKIKNKNTVELSYLRCQHLSHAICMKGELDWQMKKIIIIDTANYACFTYNNRFARIYPMNQLKLVQHSNRWIGSFNNKFLQICCAFISVVSPLYPLPIKCGTRGHTKEEKILREWKLSLISKTFLGYKWICNTPIYMI